ncbi:phage tail assembly chaperone [Chromobacterium subtsugae]|uniref:phage tail assembly chaperone n=1 Tax=Chromobacterium subtsugae TaxID=251747 RepID=UPI000641089F|nr:tail assembly chaperone [Chromobacterium subtsugae]
MIVYFSPSRCGFYDQDSSIRPADAVEVTLDAYHALLDAQAAGAVIGVDDKGQPVARPNPPATLDEQAAQARLFRDELLKDALAVLDRHASQKSYGIPTTLTEEQARQWAVYAQTLRDVPQQPDFPVKTTWPAKPQ